MLWAARGHPPPAALIPAMRPTGNTCEMYTNISSVPPTAKYNVRCTYLFRVSGKLRPLINGPDLPLRNKNHGNSSTYT